MPGLMRREPRGEAAVRQELRYGSLSRSLPLPEGVTEADIAATYKAGVLEIRVPSRSAVRPRR